MSEKDEPDQKITVLFPGGNDTDEEQSSDTPEESAEEESNPAKEGKVVHLNFDRETTRKSPRPGPDGVGEMEEVSDAEIQKYEVFQTMIEEGMVMVTLDTRQEAVDVPPQFRGLPELRLNFSHQFRLSDFDYDSMGVRASLSFQGTDYFCNIPWAAVFLLYSHSTGEAAVFEPIDSDDDNRS